MQCPRLRARYNFPGKMSRCRISHFIAILHFFKTSCYYLIITVVIFEFLSYVKPCGSRQSQHVNGLLFTRTTCPWQVYVHHRMVDVRGLRNSYWNNLETQTDRKSTIYKIVSHCGRRPCRCLNQQPYVLVQK